MATKKEIEKRLKEDKERLAAFHRGNREAQDDLRFGHKQIVEVKGKNPKKQRKKNKNELRKFMKGSRDDY
ncbi:MAG: hypothetical protein IJ778_02840 [Alphaproteobacteria bacterium]|nr:hypothetical protein [Alphaproteobacteria bacterium]